MWRRAALLSVFLDPGLVFGFGSFGPWAAFAGSLELAAHFLVGVAKSLFTLRSWWSSGLEMTAAGVIVGGATYLLGLLFKVAG